MPNQFDAVPMPMAFWSQVDTSAGPKRCWPWRGKLNGSGYGTFSRKGYGRSAHRIAAELAGLSPGSLYVLHDCDNPRCCNPAHLFIGTQRDNALDCKAKGRQNGMAKRHLGSDHGRAKLTEADVLAIREAARAWKPDRDPRSGRYKSSVISNLAEQYAVSLATIYQIVSRRVWRHI